MVQLTTYGGENRHAARLRIACGAHESAEWIPPHIYPLTPEAVPLPLFPILRPTMDGDDTDIEDEIVDAVADLCRESEERGVALVLSPSAFPVDVSGVGRSGAR